MRIAIVGGHLAPALAVIDELSDDTEIVFIGRRFTFEGDEAQSLEYKVINERGIKFIPFSTGRIQRKFTKHTLVSIFKTPHGLVNAFKILKAQKPDVVLSFGGYLSVPIGIAAYILRIPLVIHEQTLEAGMANKLLSKFATVICVSWQQSFKFFPKSKTILTGNPIRKSQVISYKLQVLNENLPLIYITGGSAGAHGINKLVEGCLQNLLEKYNVIHQVGGSKEYLDFPRISTLVKSFPDKLQKRYTIKEFIDPDYTGAIMSKASLIVSRSGINTVCEILSFGIPTLFIPLPLGQKNEQLTNAQFVKKVGLGEYILQRDLTSHKLFHSIESMIEKRHNYLVYAKEAKTLIKKDAGAQIVKIVYEVISEKK